MARRFECVEGSTSKFWEVDTDGATLTVRFGKIGATGTVQTKSFASAAECTKEADKLVREKTKKGYAEASTGAGDAGDARAEASATSAPRAKAAANKKVASYDKALLAQWRELRDKANKDGKKAHPTEDGLWADWELKDAPGAWDAFADLLDDGGIAPKTLWWLNAEIVSHVPGRHVPALLEATPAGLPFDKVYNRVIACVVGALVDDPARFDDRAYENKAIPRVLEIARLQAGVAPAGSGSQAVREWVATWVTSMPPLFVVRDGSAAPVARGNVDELTAVGAALLGEGPFRDVVAESVRAAPRRNLDQAFALVAAPVLPPEVLVEFRVPYDSLSRAAKEWSIDALVHAMKVASSKGEHDQAASLALFAIGRSPSLASQVLPYVIPGASGHGAPMSHFHWYLSKADLADLTPWCRRHLDSDASDSTWGRPLALLLLGRGDPAQAEREYDAVEGRVDFLRLSGAWTAEQTEEAHALYRQAGPAFRRSLLPLLLQMYGPERAPEELDADIEIESPLHAPVVHHIRLAPNDRGFAVLRRALAEGKRAAIMEAFEGYDEIVQRVEQLAPTPPTRAAAPRPRRKERETPCDARATCERIAAAHRAMRTIQGTLEPEEPLSKDEKKRGWVDVPLSEKDVAKLEKRAGFTFSATLRALLTTKDALCGRTGGTVFDVDWVLREIFERNKELWSARDEYDWELPKFVALTTAEDFFAVTDDDTVVYICNNEGNVERTHGDLDGFLERYADTAERYVKRREAKGADDDFESEAFKKEFWEDPEAEYA